MDVLAFQRKRIDASRQKERSACVTHFNDRSDPRVVAIAEAACELDRLRETWLNPPDASEAELKRRTLTNLYNARPTWLANAHAALDRAVWVACAWPADEVPAEVAEDAFLSRLLALNRERATP
jgi:hypothetical protein